MVSTRRAPRRTTSPRTLLRAIFRSRQTSAFQSTTQRKSAANVGSAGTLGPGSYATAIEAFNVQNFKRAEQHLSSAIELDPENHVFYSNRAAAYMALEQYDRALGDADECIRLQPEWAKGYSRRGAALFRMDKLVDARDAFELSLIHISEPTRPY